MQTLISTPNPKPVTIHPVAGTFRPQTTDKVTPRCSQPPRFPKRPGVNDFQTQNPSVTWTFEGTSLFFLFAIEHYREKYKITNTIDKNKKF